MFLLLGADVKTCLDVVVSLFYLNVVGNLFILIHRTSICTDVIMQRLLFFHFLTLNSLNLFIGVWMF